MAYHLDDTIAAIASPAGGSLRGIIRLSGPEVIACLAKCFLAASGESLENIRGARVLPGSFHPLELGRALPCDLYLWPNSRSYTGQPAAEIHTVGSPPLLGALLAELCRQGARLAEPGEFTLRAFLAGRIDLTQAEAVLGVIEADDRRQLDTALAQLAGGLAAPLAELRESLLDLLAHLEAGLDFVEEDIQFIAPAELLRQVNAAAEQVASLAAKMKTRGTISGEPRIVLSGAPNVGKSSLLNALAGSPAAIVADRPGTTRDYLTRRIVCDGLACLVVDTAGMEGVHPSSGANIAHSAQRMTSRQREQADVELLCFDSSRPIAASEQQWLQTSPTAGERIVVLTKADLPADESCVALAISSGAVRISSRTGQGLAELSQAIRSVVQSLPRGDAPVVQSTVLRCRESLDLAAQSLALAQEHARHGGKEELVAWELRMALEELGRVAGAVYTDDVLDRIFSRFCIGK